MGLLVIKMPENNFLKEHKKKDLIFIRFIYLREKLELYNHWRLEILQ